MMSAKIIVHLVFGSLLVSFFIGIVVPQLSQMATENGIAYAAGFASAALVIVILWAVAIWLMNLSAKAARKIKDADSKLEKPLGIRYNQPPENK